METKNLIIRESVFDDCSVFAQWETMEEVIEYFTIEENRDYEQVVTEFVRDNLDPTKLHFTILLKGEQKPIGKIYVTNLDTKNDSLDVTRMYIAYPELRNKGYGEEALRRFLEYAFINLHMERVTICDYVKNRAAANFLDKVGFTNEGILRNATKRSGRYFDLQLRSMLRAEYYEKIHDK